ncbi:MAG: DEAD/DEAH box helicase [Prevotella sp.]|nr:DEAD/DEAH box helicase [Prevotella sp.]
MKFEELDLSDNILDALWDMNFEDCTPIQEACIPVILDHRDVIGIAQTGTGKTAAYLLPVLSMLDTGDYPDDTINCVVMSPTRELARQIDQAMQGFGYYLPEVSSLAVYGGNDGVRFDQETKAMRTGADMLIATPGRLISHKQIGNLDLSRCSFFILDEADRMLDMGFYDDIMTIAADLPKTCQVLMFSATMPPKIEALAKKLLKNPALVKLAVSKPAEKIRQSAFVCYEGQKLKIIRHIFSEHELRRVLIFCGKKNKVKEVARELYRMKMNCGEMHSDLSQAERDEMMYRFKSGRIDVLVATDILSRGIDIDDIQVVINYDVPHDVEDYIHRIGRTARAEKDGVAITLVSQTDIFYFKKIEQFLDKTIQKNPLPPDLGDAPDYSGSARPPKPARGRRSRKPGAKHSSKRSGKRSGNKPKKQASS